MPVNLHFKKKSAGGEWMVQLSPKKSLKARKKPPLPPMGLSASEKLYLSLFSSKLMHTLKLKSWNLKKMLNLSLFSSKLICKAKKLSTLNGWWRISMFYQVKSDNDLRTLVTNCQIIDIVNNHFCRWLWHLPVCLCSGKDPHNCSFLFLYTCTRLATACWTEPMICHLMVSW